MYFQYRGTLRKLAPDDVAGIAALYPANSAQPAPAPGATPPPSPTPSPAHELVVVLEPGWNLVLLPPGQARIAAGALPCLRAVYQSEDGEWQAWIRGIPPGLQGITTFDPTRGYWALADSACALSFE
jgi:hypothetical protein